MADVNGYCPMGCGQSLVVNLDGELICSFVDCPRPTAAGELLANGETEHVVEVHEYSFAVKHPLKERVDDNLFVCRLHEDLSSNDGPPMAPGRYRVRPREEGGYSWEGLDG